jgi:SAM-dependent methyltransferase
MDKILELMSGLRRRLAFAFMYLGRPRWDTGVTPPELAAFVQSSLPGRALDLGCGTGTNTIYLAQHGWEATGVDFVGKAIRSARKRAAQAGVRVDFQQEDVTRLGGVRAPFDLALDIGCFHSLPSKGKRRYSDRLTELLAPGGVFLLYGFLRKPEGEGPGISPDDLDYLENRLEPLRCQTGTDHGRVSAWYTFRKPGLTPE